MSSDIPLVVDLDGTLLKSDMLVESAFGFLRQHPLRSASLILALMRGKASLKSKIAASVAVDPALLPYDERIVEFLTEQKAAGRQLVLATASHERYAQDIAAHLGLFDIVIASNDSVNLSSIRKRDRLIADFGEKGYDYVGNSKADLPVWRAARYAYLANPEQGVERRARSLADVQQVFPAATGGLRLWVRQLRLHQWAKNALIFVPLLASHKVAEWPLLLTGAAAFLLFGLCASSVYLLNDLLDLDDDRQHASKKLRPIACGAVSIKTALFLVPILLIAAFAGAAALTPPRFAAALAAYYLLTLAYSLGLKRIMTLDVIVLALLYTIRVIAGTFAFGVDLTFWMLAFSMFLFLSLALVKRYAELLGLKREGDNEQSKGRGYFSSDLEMIASLGSAAGYLSVMVLALYIQDQSTLQMYSHPELIWLACPLLLYWITRVWMITHRGGMHSDPVVFAIRDVNSIVVGALFGAVFLLAI